MIKNTLFAASVLGCLLASGCQIGQGGESESMEDEPIGAAREALPSERSNGTASIVYAANQTVANPDVMVNQWAEASFNGTGCNGVMIGPNTYFTAAHCGAPPNVQILFRTYRNGSTSTSDTEAFTCNELIQTFNDTDGAVFYCAPNAAGQNPGDKYGYVDFDISDPAVAQRVYSISANPWVDGTVPWDARMYATGEVTAVNDNGWFVPDQNPNTGIVMNLWAETGMSGSPHFNAANHKMMIAPLSVGGGGVTPAPKYGGWSRYANSMHSLLYWGYVNPNFDPAAQGPTVNTAFVQSLGLTPGAYYGWADKDLDWEFDVQYDLERMRGEARRGWYWLGFDSQRRNGLWDAVAFTTFDAANRWIRIQKTSGSTYADAIFHRKLDLGAGTFRVSLMTWTSSASIPGTLWVGLKNGASYPSGEYVQNTAGSGWQMHTFEITSGGAGYDLVLGARGTTDVLVSSISVVKRGETMDFDTADKRVNWRNDIDGSRAVVVPDGRTTGTPNWAVRVAPPATSGYPVRDRQLAVVGGRPYRLCYDAKRVNSGGWAQAEVRLWSGSGVAVTSQNYLVPTWTSYCTATFTPASDDNNLQIRLMGGDSPFLVDNITLTEM